MPFRTSPPKTPLRREDSYFGIHIDLHPASSDTELGAQVTPAMVRRLIRTAMPDYVQYDCKGHGGLLGYPKSNVSATPPGMTADPLAIFRKETRDAGVALLMHFSGVWDGVACNDHPEWRTVPAPGKELSGKDTGITSTFSPYVTERLIPQMKEIIDRYDVDGFWVDGECWALLVDYCDEAIKQFKDRTGQDTPPAAHGEPYWHEWMSVQRDQFFKYMRTYMDAIHAYKPGIQIASNWLYSYHAPEPVKLAVDFVSGDYAANNAVNTARFAGRQLASVGIPWDLMAWAFAWFPGVRGSIYKPPVQLQQEAATVLALGGGFQCYFHPDRHSGLSEQSFEIISRLADFCHIRRDCCHKSQPVPQVALLLDSTSVLRQMKRPYAPYSGEYNALEGTLRAMLDAGHSVDILADHQLPGQIDQWPVIVVPEFTELPPGLEAELIDYAHRGGSLLIIGAGASRLFAGHTGVSFEGEPVERDVLVHVNGRPLKGRDVGAVRVKGLWQDVSLLDSKNPARILAYRTPGFREDRDQSIAATVHKIGKGRIAAVYGPLGTAHHQVHSPFGRDLLGLILGKLYHPRVTVIGPTCIDLVLRKKDGHTLIHLNNTAGMPTKHGSDSGYYFTDYIPPTGEVTLQIRTGVRPKRVTLQPEGKRLRSTFKNGVLTVVVPNIAIHGAVMLE